MDLVLCADCVYSDQVYADALSSAGHAWPSPTSGLQEHDVPDIPGLVTVMAAVCQAADSCCLVAFECRDSSLRQQLLETAGSHFRQVCATCCCILRTRACNIWPARAGEPGVPCRPDGAGSAQSRLDRGLQACRRAADSARGSITLSFRMGLSNHWLTAVRSNFSHSPLSAALHICGAEVRSRIQIYKLQSQVRLPSLLQPKAGQLWPEPAGRSLCCPGQVGFFTSSLAFAF